MSKYITDLQVSLNEAQEDELRKQDFIKSDVDLNKGARGKNIHLWYKKGDSGAITRILFSFSDATTKGLNEAGYQKINKNLNAGAGGDDIYLWFFKGSSDYHVPIVNLYVSTSDDAQKFKDGWERLACDLNRNDREYWVYLWVKRENPTYICDLAATSDFQGDVDYFKTGFIRVDKDTSGEPKGASVFIWCRHTTRPEGAIRDLKVSITDDEAKGFQKQGYHPHHKNLNEGTGGNPVYLWYKKHGIDGDPIKAITQVVTEEAAQAYEAVKATVIWKNLNAGVRGAPELYLCCYR